MGREKERKTEIRRDREGEKRGEREKDSKGMSG